MMHSDRDLELASLERLIESFKDASPPQLREQVAHALVAKGTILAERHRPEEAIAAFDEAIDRFDPSAREKIANAIYSKGVVLQEVDRGAEAICVYDSLAARFRDANEPALREMVASALFNKGLALRGLNRFDEAIGAYDQVKAGFQDASDPSLRHLVAISLFNKAVTLERLSRLDESLAAFDELIAHFADSSDPSLKERVAKALFNKALVLDRLNRQDDAIVTYDELTALYGDAPELPVRQYVANALFNKAVLLQRLGRPREAIAANSELVTRFEDVPDVSLSLRVAGALINRAMALHQSARADEAIADLDHVVRRFGESVDSDLRERVADALFDKAVILDGIDRTDEAIAVYDDFVGRFQSDVELQEKVANALLNRGLTLARLGRVPEAIEAYDSVIGRLEHASESNLRRIAETARSYRNSALSGESSSSSQLFGLTASSEGDEETDLRGALNEAASFGNLPPEEIVLYATDREAMFGGKALEFSNSGIPASELSYGQCLVTLPPYPHHHTGHLESPHFGQSQDPNRHVILAKLTPFEGATAFHQTLVSRLAAASRRDVMIFVHGVATSFETAVRRAAQLRLDTEFPGVAIAYSWPSKGAVLGYVADYDMVETAATRLEQVLMGVLLATPNEACIHVVGHSLGCLIVARAISRTSIEDRERLGEVILAAPDISRLDYPRLAGALQERARRVTVYAAPADRALLVSSMLRASIERVGSNVEFASYPGVDAIDASGIVKKSWFGDRHGYVFEAPMVGELRAVLDGSPQPRARLERRRSSNVEYYVIRP
jgi:esterase/lipase superfamily enzyme